MPKFDRKRLARGTKLVPSHITDPITSAAATGVAYAVNSCSLTRDNLAKKWAPFRVNLSVPYIEGKFQETGDVFTGSGNISKPFSIPFTLPPLQDSFNVDTFEGRKYPDTTTAPPPVVVLDEVSISVDQRAEPSALASQYLNAAQGNSLTNTGKLDYTNWDKMTMRASVLTKNPVFFGGQTPMSPNSIWTIEVAYNQWAAQGPFVIKDIAKVVDPWKTMVFALEFPDMAGADVAVCNVNISMKFRHELVERDTGGSTAVQNCPPLVHTRQTRTLKSQDTISITTPASDSTIISEGAGGVSDNLGRVDEAAAAKFKGGVDKDGEAGPVEEIETDSGYSVIAVPLFSNRRNGGISPYDVEKEPYVVAGNNSSALWDRRLIPITYPMAVHHVVLCYNWQGWISYPQQWGLGTNNQLQVPQTSTFQVDVGVGIATGLKSDDFTYEQVAELTMTQPNLAAGTWMNKQIDAVKSAQFSAYGRTGIPYGYHGWDWDVLSVPIVGNQGKGFYTQGEPYYIGKSRWPTAVTSAGATNRTDVLQGDGAARAPRTSGQEQWIEVRMKISDSGGLFLTDAASGAFTGGAQSANTFISGYQGHWVYIIGKKFLT